MFQPLEDNRTLPRLLCMTAEPRLNPIEQMLYLASLIDLVKHTLLNQAE